MPPADSTFIGALPKALSLLGDILFRWVPASITVIGGEVTSTSSPYITARYPLSVWDVPGLLERTSDTATYQWLAHAWYGFAIGAFVLSLPFLAVVVYCFVRILQIRRMERRAFQAAQRTVAAQDISRTQLRWRRVLEQASSSSPEQWRLAVLEADIMLNELLDLQGYKGETMADKMKRVDRANFNSIDSAWEAHRVRNRIAHEGTSHELSSREVRRIIALYERVFREFKFIE